MEQTRTTYSFFARQLHWINAILLIVTWGLHDVMEGNDALLRLHILIGTVALVTTVLQFVWYLVDKKPAELADLTPWRKLAIHWNHRLIMLAAFLASATGLGLTLGSGLGLLPSIAEMDNIRRNIFHEPHEIASNGLLLLFLMHVVGVLSYHFTKGNTLGRMAPLLFGRNRSASS